MALVYNASSVDQKVKVFGKYFDIPSGKIKQFTDNVARFLITERTDRGLIGLPDKFEDMEYRDSSEGKKQLAELRAMGVRNRIEHLKRLIHNETVSLQQDLDQKGIKVDARAYMSQGMVDVMEELASYQKSKDDTAEERIKKIRELESKLK